ncbi:hypothetical protein MPSEU_000485800 [Mayamaea pseudoterrestris]|nr:hypothetical protein MPSEU_000485800 [Mayamaea pseudoterrestris]
MASPLASRDDSQLVWVKSWDAKIPPPITSFKGKVVPRLFLRSSRRRKIAIEVHRIYSSAPPNQTTQPPDSSTPAFYEQCVVRILVPDTKATRIVNETINTRENGQDESETDESTILPQEFIDTEAELPSDHHDGWKAKYRFPIRSISITNSHKNVVSVYIVLGRVRQHRELYFATDEDAQEFAQALQAQLDQEPDRTENKLAVTARGVTLNEDESITLLVEICGARNLLAGDKHTSDPYVQVLFDGIEIHRTDYISRNLNPIWTVKTNSLFLWTVNSRDLFMSEGLLCVVFDFDQVGSHENLGQTYVSPKFLYATSEERTEQSLKHPHNGDAGTAAGFLAVRCRRATDYDKHFMQELAEKRKKEKREEAMPELQKLKDLTKLATESTGGSGNFASIIARRSKVVRSAEHPEGVKVYKVRPGPDPVRPKETIWLSKEQLRDESLKESHLWIDSGSGHLGNLFVEVIACDDLPNMDTGGFVGNKTDAFVSVVFEDSFVTTDVVGDCLAPRWMPWTKRAFMFRMMHSSSQLFLGVFDYDLSFNPADGHDFIGRVSIDLSNLRKDTTYILTYNLYTSARMSQRKKRGTVTLRLRLEIDDDRQLLLSSLDPPPQIRVNTKSWKDHHVVRCTCTGKTDMNKYSMQIINSYVEELLALQQAGFYMRDAAVSLFLWRCTSPIKLLGRSIALPVHSITAFILSALVVERPQLFPSFVLFGIAWLLLASMEYRRHLPDLWSRCKSYKELAGCLIFGESRAAPELIAPYTNSSAAEAFMIQWQKRIADVEDAASRDYEQDFNQADDDTDALPGPRPPSLAPPKRAGGISLDPFRPILFPIQQNLAVVCRFVRHAKYIIFWEECYITFWIVSVCLVLGTLFLFVPWFYLIQSSARILVWSLLGPWMRLVDVLYVSKGQFFNVEDMLAPWEGALHLGVTSSKATRARVNQENVEKLKAMKEYMFGRFVTRVPVLKEDRYRDMPLAESSAVPYRPALVPLSELAMQEAGYKRKRLMGQHMTGTMIPQVSMVASQVIAKC